MPLKFHIETIKIVLEVVFFSHIGSGLHLDSNHQDDNFSSLIPFCNSFFGGHGYELSLNQWIHDDTWLYGSKSTLDTWIQDSQLGGEVHILEMMSAGRYFRHMWGLP